MISACVLPSNCTLYFTELALSITVYGPFQKKDNFLLHNWGVQPNDISNLQCHLCYVYFLA